jgi:hypothetical protein
MNRFTAVYMHFSPESRLSDIRALLDSYAIEVNVNGLTYLRAPLHFCKLGIPAIPESKTHGYLVGPVLDNTAEVKMIRYEPPNEDFLHGIRERNTRWLFYVEYPLSVQFLLSSDLWWEFKFIPGEVYKE